MTMQNHLTRVDDEWEAAAPNLFAASPEERRAAIALIRELAKGEPITSAQLAQALGSSTRDADAFLNESCWAPVVDTDPDGRIVGFWGLSAVPTPHRFAVGGRTLWTWCAYDTLFLPELIGELAEIESRDPETGEPVRLAVSPRGIEAVEPAGTVMSMVHLGSADLTSTSGLIETACCFILFFASQASGERWTAAHPNTRLVSLDEAFAAAKRQNARQFVKPA